MVAGIIPCLAPAKFIENGLQDEPRQVMSHATPAAARITRAFSATSHPAVRSILVVDDEENIRLAVTKFLRSRGFEVSSAESGESAIERLEQEKFDAMLCDVRMPAMSGLEVVPRARALQPDLAILMLTAVNDAPAATEALASGAVDYLMKPVELPDLAYAIDRALRKRDLDIQIRQMERLVREEVSLATGDLDRERRQATQASIDIVRSLVDAHEAKDPYRRGHSQRVGAIAAAVAVAMGVSDDEVERIRLAGQLHDIGRIAVPEALSDTPGPLSPEQYALIKEHVRLGVALLAPVPALVPALLYIQDHHEHWDGSGYPRGLAGGQISLGGRILHAVESFDAVTSRRAYRDAMTAGDAIDYFATLAGSRFDPAVFDALRALALRSDGPVVIDRAP